jgi:secreted trypsin-like serine protease
VVAGWGQTSRNKGGITERKLQFAYVDTYSVEECQAKYDKFLAGRGKVWISKKMLCTGNMKADSCAGETAGLIATRYVLLLLAGDSGGPMLHQDQAFRWTVSGVVSFGPSSCGNIVPGVYTRVDRYTDWIYRVMGMLSV